MNSIKTILNNAFTIISGTLLILASYFWALFSIAAAFSIIVWIALSVGPQIPYPTGAFSVGTAEYHLIDSERKEPHTATKKDHRELMIQVWYPATPVPHAKPQLYIPYGADIIQQAISEQAQIPLSSLEYLKTLPSHSYRNAPVSDAQLTYPIILFSPGAGMPAHLYASILETIASHGYIVVGINYPYDTDPVVFPDGRIIRQVKTDFPDEKTKIKARTKQLKGWVKDLQLVLNELERINRQDPQQLLTNRLDLAHVGALGHSLGGSAVLELCKIDKRCRACIDMDGKSYNIYKQPLNVPSLFLIAAHDEKILAPLKEFYMTLQEPSYFIEINNAGHGSFTDLYLLTKWDSAPKLNQYKATEIVRNLVVSFFDCYLKDEMSDFLINEHYYTNHGYIEITNNLETIERN